MSPDRLVYMANQIGKFFQYQRKDEIVPGIASHIKKFWDPRMRKQLTEYIDGGGKDISPLAIAALSRKTKAS